MHGRDARGSTRRYGQPATPPSAAELICGFAAAAAVLAMPVGSPTCAARGSPTLRSAVGQCRALRYEVPLELRPAVDLLCDSLALGHVALFALVLLNCLCFVPALGDLPSWGVTHETLGHRRLLSYQFAHANTPHLLGNMLTLLAVGAEVTAALGCDHIAFVALYLACGWAGGCAAASLSKPNTSTVGASGSISGVIVALSVLRPHDAVAVLGDVTAASPLMLLLGTLGADLSRGGVSWQAHLGGGAAGYLLASLRLLLHG